jgi:hypothetical protein
MSDSDQARPHGTLGVRWWTPPRIEATLVLPTRRSGIEVSNQATPRRQQPTTPSQTTQDPGEPQRAFNR